MAVWSAQKRRPQLSYLSPSPLQLRSQHGHPLPAVCRGSQQHPLPHFCRELPQCLLVQSLCEREHVQAAADALLQIHFPLPAPTYLSLLKACIKSKSLSLAMHTRRHITLHSVPLTGFLGDYLVMTLAKCGAADDARNLSASLPHRTVFSWTAIIFAYADSDQGKEALEAYQCMLNDGIEPDSFTFVSLFKACGSIPDLDQGKALHACARSMGLARQKFVGNTIVSMYGKCGAISDAEDVFTALTDRDTVSWNGMLSAYVEQGLGENCLLLYRQLHEEGMVADLATFVIALQSCATLAEDENGSRFSKCDFLELGRALHSDARKRNFDSHFLVGTAILTMYSHCGSLLEAESMFSILVNRDIIAWNAMLSVYIEQEQAEKALCLFVNMQEGGVSPDVLTYVSAVQACSILGEKEKSSLNARSTALRCLEIGKALHSDLRRKGYTADTIIANTLVSMYGKCGALAEAEEVFCEIDECDVISWNAMLSAYCEQGQQIETLSLFRMMQAQQASVSEVTFLCVLQACGEAGDFELCRSVNFSIVSAGLDKLPSVTASLVNAYGSSASVVDAKVVFDGFVGPSVVLWNACIAGHAAEKTILGTLHMFERMRLTGFMPDTVTYTSLLAACSHNGLVDECLEYLSVDSGGMTGGIKHWNIIIDLFGRAGDFKRLVCFFKKIKLQADMISWSNILGACSVHGNLELATHVFDQALHMEPTDASLYVVMSNVYADAGLRNWPQIE